MPFVWLVECKTCTLKFGVKPRTVVPGKAPGKATETLVPGKPVGSFECPHCHDSHPYTTDDFIPGEGRIHNN